MWPTGLIPDILLLEKIFEIPQKIVKRLLKMVIACVEKKPYVSISIIMLFLLFIAVGGLRLITIARP